MAFCSLSLQIACLGDWGRGGKGSWSVSISPVKVRQGEKGLTTTQNAFCARRIWLPAGILMVFYSVSRTMACTWLGSRCEDCEWTYFGHMFFCRLAICLRSCSKQSVWARVSVSRWISDVWLAVRFHSSSSYLPLSPVDMNTKHYSPPPFFFSKDDVIMREPDRLGVHITWDTHVCFFACWDCMGRWPFSR